MSGGAKCWSIRKGGRWSRLQILPGTGRALKEPGGFTGHSSGGRDTAPQPSFEEGKIMQRLRAIAFLAAPLALTAAAAPVALSAQAAPAGLAQVQAHLRAVQTMTAAFAQSDRRGHNLNGTLIIRRPGHIRFDYGRSANMLIVGDGN